MRFQTVCGIGCAVLAVLGGCGRRSGVPPIPDLAYHRARHAMDQGRWDWARIYLEQDLEAHPERVESLGDLGIAWISGYGGGLSQGVPFLQRFLEARPDDQAIRWRLVATLIRLGKIQDGKRWGSGLDDTSDSRYLRGLLLEDADPAETLVELSLAADHAGALVLGGKIEEKLGGIESALKWTEQGLEIDPFDPKGRARYQRLLKRTGHRFEAERQLRALDIVGRLSQSQDAAQLSLAEELPLLRELRDGFGAGGTTFDRRLAEVLLRSGRIEQGLGLLDRLDREGGLSTTDRLIFAKILANGGKRSDARRQYERILETAPDDPTALSSLALLDCAVGRYGPAIRRIEEALGSDPWVAVYHATLGQARLLSGDQKGAIDGFSTALELAPWESRWRRALADLLRARGESMRADRLEAEAPNIDQSAFPVHTGRIDGDEVDDSLIEEVGVEGEVPADQGEGWWAEISAEVGLDFVQYDGRSGRRYYVETTAAGCGFFDFDGDGDLDVYLLTGAPTPGSAPVESAPRNVLFENREGRFVDVTSEAGVGDEGFGMGMCVGDVDGDGLLDFLVTNYGPDRLFRSRGDGTFEEISRQAGVDDPRWSSNCAFGDLDGDGDLDLYVSHYLKAGFEDNPFCGDRARNISAYCRPSVFEGVSDSLFINSGDGRFTEEGVGRGILQGVLEKGFGVVLTDLDDDEDLDIFVANDSTPNRLYINDGRGYFEEMGLVSGLGLNDQGMPTSGMGVDIGDLDGDLDQDVILTNYAMEANSLYRNLGNAVFEDVARATGMAASSRPHVGWGARLADFDNDGDLDLAIANGHVIDNIALFEPDNSYEQSNRLMLNDGAGNLSDASASAGPPWREAKVSRALTVGDWNNDGRMDLLIANSNDRFELLENRAENGNHWLGVQLIGVDPNVVAIGARVIAKVGDRRMMREVRSGTGFQSQGDLRLHFGLGGVEGPVELQIRWPDGFEQVESIDQIDRYVVIERRR